MAYTRSRGTQTRLTIRRGTPYRKRARMTTVRRIPRSVRGFPKIVNFKRGFYSQQWVFSTAAIGGYYQTLSLQLGQIPNNTEFTNLFKQYRIKAFKWTFVPRFDSASTADAAAGAPLGYLYINRNRENTAITGTYSAATLNNVMEKPYKVLQTNKPRSIYMKCNTIADSEIQYNKWLTTVVTGIGHFGLDVYWWFPGAVPTVNVVMDIHCCVYLQCKGVK